MSCDNLASMHKMTRSERLEFCEKDLQTLENEANRGVVESQLLLFEAYRWGHSPAVAVDLEKAVKWAGVAAESGQPEALVEFALCLLEGLGPGEDLTARKVEACRLLELAAVQGDSEAMYLLAVRSRMWPYTIEHEGKFEIWIKKAAEHEYVVAMLHMADLSCGEEAVDWEKKAKELKVKARQDYVCWLQAEAARGSAVAMRKIGDMFTKEANQIEAARFYSMAEAAKPGTASKTLAQIQKDHQQADDRKRLLHHDRASICPACGGEGRRGSWWGVASLGVRCYRCAGSGRIKTSS
jgi:TPR repeat protein